MKGLIAVALLLVSTNLTGQERSVRPSSFEQRFMMQEVEDGEQSKDSFEIWTVSGDFSRTNGSTCKIQATSLTSTDEETHIFNWLHEGRTITEILPGIFKMGMNGRLNPFSGLEVVIEFSQDRTRIVDLSGSMRAGTRGQSVVVFQVDRDSRNRKIPPVYNPSRKVK
jgi:hypothetical protein